MNEKILYIIEAIGLLVVFLLSVVFIGIPEFKNSLGSSDHFIDTNNYEDLVEIQINGTPNFGIITNKNKIVHLFFFDNPATCLYNKEIETKTISKGMKIIIDQLIENNYLKQDDTLTITNYNNKSYSTVKSSLEKELVEQNITISLIEKNNTIIERAQELNITATEESKALKEIDLYSKNIIRHNKNTESKKTTTTSKILDETLAKTYANNVYLKIEENAKNQNITNQEKDSTNLPIHLIPGDPNMNYYPTTDSWYYISDSKIYAYIKFTSETDTYSFCYTGSIDNYKKGEC